MKKRTITAILSIVLATAVILGGCGKAGAESDSTGEAAEASAESTDGNKKLVIGYVDSGSSFPNEGLSVAIDQGFLEEELSAAGYTVELIPFTGAGPAINEALVNKSIDIASTGDVPAILGRSNGIETTLLAGEIRTNDAAIVVQANSDIQTIKDLKGKTVATLQGSYMHKTLIDMLEANGMAFSDVQFTNMVSADAAAAVEAGSVDAAVVANTQEAALSTSENVRILLNCEGHDEWKGGHSLLARTDYLQENRAAAVAFIKAMIRSNDYAKENRESAIESLSKSGPTAEALEFLYPDSVNFNLSSDENTISAYSDIKQFLLNNELIKNDFDLNEWIDKSIYEEANGK